MKTLFAFGLTAIAALLTNAAMAGLVTTPFSESFDTFNPASPAPLTAASNAGSAASIIPEVFGAGDNVLQVEMTGAGADAYALYGTAQAGVDFSVSVAVQGQAGTGQAIDFSNVEFGVTAAGAINASSVPADVAANPFLVSTPTSGYKFFVDTNFSGGDSDDLILENGDNVIASTPLNDFTDVFQNFNGILSLVGTYLPSGDLELVGTLTDLAGGDDSTVLMATVAVADQQTGADFGLFQFQPPTGNRASVAFNNLAIDVVAIPEPSCAILWGGVALSAFVTCRRGRS